MGKSKRQRGPKIPKASTVLAANLRCTYCEAASTEIEHMPPKAMFRKRQRDGAMVFACCKPCNQGTSDADLFASFAARLSPIDGGGHDFLFAEAMKFLGLIKKRWPEFPKEFAGPSHQMWLRNPNTNLHQRFVSFRLDSPTFKMCLDTFSAKLGMALFREHTGTPIPRTGGVQFKWYLNAGISDDELLRLLQPLPLHAHLSQGRLNSKDQFQYRYNTDGRSIVMAISRFHFGLSVLTLASAVPGAHGMPLAFSPHLVQPGQLISMMPKRTGPP